MQTFIRIITKDIHMPLMTWSDDLSVGVHEIDGQHQKLIELINTLHDAMLARKGKETVSTIIDELAAYTVYHFSTEEKYMGQYKYAGIVTHKREHEGFVRKVEEFQDNYKNNKIGLSIEIMTFLKEWVTGHIRGTDQQYTAHFNKNGLS